MHCAELEPPYKYPGPSQSPSTKVLKVLHPPVEGCTPIYSSTRALCHFFHQNPVHFFSTRVLCTFFAEKNRDQPALFFTPAAAVNNFSATERMLTNRDFLATELLAEGNHLSNVVCAKY